MLDTEGLAVSDSGELTAKPEKNDLSPGFSIGMAAIMAVLFFTNFLSTALGSVGVFANYLAHSFTPLSGVASALGLIGSSGLAVHAMRTAFEPGLRIEEKEPKILRKKMIRRAALVAFATTGLALANGINMVEGHRATLLNNKTQPVIPAPERCPPTTSVVPPSHAFSVFLNRSRPVVLVPSGLLQRPTSASLTLA